MDLIDSLIQQGFLKSPRIIKAFRNIKRADFLPEDKKNLAELNEALPIGYGQTISQPLVVAFMLELLEPKLGDKILDIGSGSGWTTALLAEIVGPRGKVIAIETIPALKEFGEGNVVKYNFTEQGIVKFICADGAKGYPNFAACPELAEGFDKVLASASIQPVEYKRPSKGVDEIPQNWKEQLKIGGRIVAPIGSSIWLFIKNSPAGGWRRGRTEFSEKEYPGFAFVPFVAKN